MKKHLLLSLMVLGIMLTSADSATDECEITFESIIRIQDLRETGLTVSYDIDELTSLMIAEGESDLEQFFDKKITDYWISSAKSSHSNETFDMSCDPIRCTASAQIGGNVYSDVAFGGVNDVVQARLTRTTGSSSIITARALVEESPIWCSYFEVDEDTGIASEATLGCGEDKIKISVTATWLGIGSTVCSAIIRCDD